MTSVVGLRAVARGFATTAKDLDDGAPAEVSEFIQFREEILAFGF